MLQSGGGDYVDLMNFHYYPVFRSRWDPYGPGIAGKANYLRARLAQYGMHKPSVCTEMGIWSEEANDHSHELQSRLVTQLYAQSLAADLEIGIWFTLIDGSRLEPTKWGLLDLDLNPKPAYFAYRTAVKQLATATYTSLPGAPETGSEEIEAHRFLGAGGSTWILVAWTKDDRNHAMTLNTPQVVVADKFGAQTLILDGDDGRVDGRVRVPIGPSPVYVRYSQ